MASNRFSTSHCCKLEDHPLKYSVHSRLRLYHLKRMLPCVEKRNFLDVGCGLGYLSESLSDGYFSVGIDRDLNGLKANLKRGLQHMIQSSANIMPFRENSFDVILCSEVLEHLPDGEDERALHEMARILRPGGRILITVPSLEGLRATSILRNLGHNDPSGGEYHYRMGYAWKDVEALLRKIPSLRIFRRKYSMFLISELFMDLLKWVYLKKNKYKEHSDLVGAQNSMLFKIYRRVFPFLHTLFLVEDKLLASLFNGHILILALQKKG